VCAVPPVGAPFFAIGNDSHWVSASNRCNSGAGGTLMTFTADRPQLVRMIKGHDLVLTQYDISTLEQGCTGAPSLV
jgi:hypothetical protein